MSGKELQQLAEGKTKIIWGDPENKHQVIIESKDDITAGDGAKRHMILDKGTYAAATTAHVFRLLNLHGIPTHYVGEARIVEKTQIREERSFTARRLRMIPIECVTRRLATGSFRKRHPEVPEGERFAEPVVEFYFKNDLLHDPLMAVNQPRNSSNIGVKGFFLFNPKLPLGTATLMGDLSFFIAFPGRRWQEGWFLVECMELLTKKVFRLVEAAWKKLGVDLVDLKIECGFDEETGSLVVGDVIDNDSWRIWPGGDPKRALDKQVYRDIADPTPEDLARIRENYRSVMEQTAQFLQF